MSEKDSLVSLNPAQVDNYTVKPSQFPSSGKGQMAEGKDQLCSQGEYQSSPRCEQDDGMGSSGAGTPSNWGKGGTGFKIERNKGEGESAPSAISDRCSVDLVTGKITVKGYAETKVDEVGDPHAKIPSR
jgi:hypothetical protein